MPDPDIRIVLVRPKSSANVGAAARAMKNFGLGDLVLVAPRCRLDRQAYALASHADDVLAACRTVDTIPEAIADRERVLGSSARERASESFVCYPPEPGLSTLLGSRGALLFGPEDHGLATDELAYCQGYIAIPTAEYASINLAQAVNILAYTLYGLRSRGSLPPQIERGNRAQHEAMYRQLLEAMLLIGYTDSDRAGSIERLYRGIFDRAELSARELAALRGLWQQTLWAAEQPPERLPGRRGDR